MSETTAGLASPTLWNASSSAPSVGLMDTAGISRVSVLRISVPYLMELGIRPFIQEPPVIPNTPRMQRRAQQGEALLRAYARRFEQSLRLYEGPDEPPDFEPEDYAVR